MLGRWCSYVWSIELACLVDRVCMFGRQVLYDWSIGFVCLVDKVCICLFDWVRMFGR